MDRVRAEFRSLFIRHDGQGSCTTIVALFPPYEIL